jgi:chromosome segregation ATPase
MKMKHIILSLFGLLVLSSLTISVQAKTAVEEREDIRQVRAEVRETIAPLREAAKENRESIRDTRVEAKDIIAPLREAAKEQKKENVAERCTKVTENIDKRIAKFESDHNGRVKVFMTIKERVQERITKLKARGIDVATLEANLVTLQTKIDKLTTDHAAYMEKLKATKAFVCGQSQGEFKAALEAARDAQKVVFADAKDIIAFIKDTLKPNLEALKALVTPPTKVTPTAEPIE